MSTTRTEQQPTETEQPNDTSRHTALERAIADAEKGLRRLANDVEQIARNSAMLTGAEKDAGRFAEWLHAKTRDLRESLWKMERDARALELRMEERLEKVKDTVGKSGAVKGVREDLHHLKDRVGARLKSREEHA